MRLLRIQPAIDNRVITIREPLSYETNVLKNRLWYRGEPSELDQFFKQTATDQVSSSRFWAAVPSAGLNIRKIHSGLPAMIVDRLADIVTSDLNSIELETEAQQELWDAISEDNKFPELIGEAIVDTLVTGDGAFKISIDAAITKYPIIEYFSGERVEYRRVRGRLQEVVFYTDYTVKDKDYRLEEVFGRGYINYQLLNSDGKEVPLATVPELAELVDVTYPGDFIMAVPLMFF
ncbi:MAG TPA: capsid protein, partial [Bacillota bacterium]|nr:capsid protein [Bacillota bacterium]